jgi:hypothetical protein
VGGYIGIIGTSSIGFRGLGTAQLPLAVLHAAPTWPAAACAGRCALGGGNGGKIVERSWPILFGIFKGL